MNLSPQKKQIVSFAIVSILSLTTGWLLGSNQLQLDKLEKGQLPGIAIVNKQPSKYSQVDMSQFWEVWSIANSKYLEKDKIDQNKMVQGAIAGMVESLDDPYSMYLTPKQNTQAKEDLEGAFEGVGMELGFNKDKILIVISPISGFPAEKAGIRAGDKIWKIEDKETPGMALSQAVEMIRGQRGTQVNLKVQHEGDEDLTDIAITRDKINIKTVEVTYFENNTIARLKINRFGDPTQAEWDAAVSEVTSKNIKKIILDVRNNPGGYLNTAVHINSEFMDGIVLKQENYLGQQKQYTATHQARLKGTQIIGLINKGSASASEIVSGGLQDRGVAKLVGENSFGKGTIQEVETLGQGAGLHITTGKWLLPSGKWIHKIGLKPDYEVKLSIDDIQNKKDPQLDKAIELLK